MLKKKLDPFKTLQLVPYLVFLISLYSQLNIDDIILALIGAYGLWSISNQRSDYSKSADPHYILIFAYTLILLSVGLNQDILSMVCFVLMPAFCGYLMDKILNVKGNFKSITPSFALLATHSISRVIIILGILYLSQFLLLNYLHIGVCSLISPLAKITEIWVGAMLLTMLIPFAMNHLQLDQKSHYDQLAYSLICGLFVSNQYASIFLASAVFNYFNGSDSNMAHVSVINASIFWISTVLVSMFTSSALIPMGISLVSNGILAPVSSGSIRDFVLKQKSYDRELVKDQNAPGESMTSNMKN